ncbi:1-pyrroline-5-carboxylate dehydrogenase [Amnibacterium flavum]|uniref:L-glutamate gamma-semialdehyde dehydrogenase n=2 Tax=Amnibacterium flavum TaxID=2173173 RepID=A0A2V1HUY6_9MICO|nr:1-pyrroline-5-carboxylate dehydrogenase [Amnibacterium flavum]
MADAPDDLSEMADAAVLLARDWAATAAGVAPDASAARLAGVLADPRGLPFTLGFVDGVLRPDDARIAAANLREVARITPAFLPAYQRGAIRLGAVASRVAPGIVVPAAKSVFRRMVQHLIIDSAPGSLGRTITRLRRHGDALNINLLGEAVLGEREAARRLAGIKSLLARDDVDYVSIKISAIAPALSMWAFDETVDLVESRLAPIYEMAAASTAAGRPKFINLDMEEYRDLDLTIAVFTRLLDRPGMTQLEAGIVLQAYLPDALGAMQRLSEWATARVDAGGARIKVRLVKGANLPMEVVESRVHGWPLATAPSKLATDANYKRVLDWAMTPERTRSIRLGVAGHNLFDIAFARTLSERRGVTGDVEFEMLLGMATGQVAAVRAAVGHVLLYTPVVARDEFDAAVSYLVRRLQEGASPENFLSASTRITSDPSLWTREETRFRASVDALRETRGELPGPNRTQDRTAPAAAPRGVDEPFAGEPDTDPALPANRAWGRAALVRATTSTAGIESDADAPTDSAGVDALVERVRAAGTVWGTRPAAERAALLETAASALAAGRDRLIEVSASETGKTIAEADPEISEAIDFARYYARQALGLESVDGARFEPVALTLVVGPWNFPVAIPFGGVAAALAAGSAVILKAAPQARRTAAVVCELLWAAGVPRDLVALADVPEDETGKALITHESIDRVILTGSFETAELFRSWNPRLPLMAETSGKNAVIVTPAADLDIAVAETVRSAFGHAGQKCSAASLVVLVGSLEKSDRFTAQLIDAVTSLRVGPADSPLTQMGPLVEEPGEKLLGALTRLEPGEKWLVEPRRVNDSLWTPGVKTGVRRGSAFHRTEYFGPVLGVMTAPTLADAISIVNETDFGLTSGLFTQDPAELAQWLQSVEAGNLYVNRATTGAIVERQPFGGWKRSSVGAGTKAGGPSYLAALGDWRDAPTVRTEEPGISPAIDAVLAATAPHLTETEQAWLRDAAASDESSWRTEFGIARDRQQLGLERNLLRYLPVPVELRASRDASTAQLLRALIAAQRAGSVVTVSVPDGGIAAALGAVASPRVEADTAWLERMRAETPARVRIVGGAARAALADDLATAVAGAPDVSIHAGESVRAGRVELLAYLREQAVTVVAHRFGEADSWSESVV